MSLFFDGAVSHMPAEFARVFKHQKAAYFERPVPSYAQRIADLQALSRLLKDNRDAIVRAIHQDYGNRSEFETLFAEFFVVLETLKDAQKNLKKWMKPQRRHIDWLMYPGASNRVVPQPLGVVGVIVPWNFPLNLSFCPLAAIFAAGNRAMVKMSHNSKHLAALLIDIAPNYFPEEKLKFFNDPGDRGPAFSSLPFDHLLFTGSGATGRAVMTNAAENLTPVTLELGGKSPAIVGPDFSIQQAAERIMWVKLFNAGQICTTVDYVFVPEDRVDEFVAHCQRVVQERVPDINGSDFTSIIDQHSYDRLMFSMKDAENQGATLLNLLPEQTPNTLLRKIAPHLVLNPTSEMLLMQREIFGPILPIKTYRHPEEVAQYINSQDRPLAIYPFTHDRDLQDFYISHVMSGGVSVNEALLHVAQHDLPFGGVGASGMGHYHAQEGFNTFSKLRPVFYQGPFSAIQMLFLPPYKGRALTLMNWLIKLKG